MVCMQGRQHDAWHDFGGSHMSLHMSSIYILHIIYIDLSMATWYRSFTGHMTPARFSLHICFTHSRIHIQVVTCKHQHSNMYFQVSKIMLTKSTCIYPQYNHIHTQIHTEPSNRKRKRRRQMRKTVCNKDCYGHLSLGLGLSELLLLCLNLGHIDAEGGLIHTVGILSATGVRMTERIRAKKSAGENEIRY